MTQLGTDLRDSTALVTGASGFIGTAVCRELQRAGVRVHGVSRAVASGDHCHEWSRVDLGDLTSVRAMISTVRPDFVFHLASHVAGSRDLQLVGPTFSSNLASTVHVLIAATESQVQRTVLTGSLEEPDAGEDAVPCSPYAAAKFAASAYARMFHALYATPVVVLRLFMVYGPGQRDTQKLIPYVITSFLAGRAPSLSSGRRLVDWVYVDDVVRSFLAAATASGIDGATLDVGTGRLTSIRAVIEHLVSVLEPLVQPQFGAMPDRQHERERRAQVATTTKALGWRPLVDLPDGLRLTASWFRDSLESLPKP